VARSHSNRAASLEQASASSIGCHVTIVRFKALIPSETEAISPPPL
jgi:hypothetical protein